MISIKTKSSTITKSDFVVTLNDLFVEFDIVGDSIVIQGNLQYQMYKLELTTVNPVCVEVDSVFLNGCNIRELVYLGYIDHNNKRLQPSTILWGEAGLTWNLNFVYPLSRWIDVNSRKFLRSEVATDLSTKYHVMYPQSVNIQQPDIPQTVKDFYQANFDYTVIQKDNFDLCEVPYLKYTRYIPPELLSKIAQEFAENFDYLKEASGIKTSIDSAGVSEDKNWKLHWLVDPPGNPNKNLEKFPAIQKLLDYLQIEVFYLFVGILPPGGFIYPHCDNYEHNINGHERFDGCTQLYIPVVWPEGCSIKMANAGIVPLDQGTMLINTDYVAHAGVNLGTQNRIIIALRTTQEEVLKNYEFI